MKLGDLAKKLCRIADLDKVWRDYKHVYEHGHPKGISTGWFGFDEYFTLLKGQLNVLTGTPSSGKSEWLMAMTVNLAKNNDWNFFYVYSREPATHQNNVRISGKNNWKAFYRQIQQTKNEQRGEGYGF